MTLQNFEQRQPGYELKKGFDYFRGKRIIRLKEGDIGEWTADVRGRDPYKYKVEIRVEPIEEIEEIEISDTTCSCPVGKPFCKHIIAVLYALREEYELSAPADETLGKPADISKIPDEELRVFLQRYVAVNEDFLKIVTTYTSAKEEERERVLYEMHIWSVAQAVTESYGMIEQDQVPIVIKAVDSLLAKAEAALAQKNYEQVIAISFAVAETMTELTPSMEQSSYHPDNSIVEAVDLLMKVAKAALPADLRARLSTLVQKEFVKKKYDKLDIDVEWMELMELVDPEKVAAWDKRIADSALADKARKGGTDEDSPADADVRESEEKSISRREEARELLEEAADNFSIDQPGKHYELVAEVMPEEWLELYEDKIREYAEDHKGGESYAIIGRALKKMQTFPGGKAAVQNLADQLIREYKRRPPFIDMLKKFL